MVGFGDRKGGFEISNGALSRRNWLVINAGSFGCWGLVNFSKYIQLRKLAVCACELYKYDVLT